MNRLFRFCALMLPLILFAAGCHGQATVTPQPTATVTDAAGKLPHWLHLRLHREPGDMHKRDGVPGASQQWALHSAADNRQCSDHAELHGPCPADRRLCGLHFPIRLSDRPRTHRTRDRRALAELDRAVDRALSGHAGDAERDDYGGTCAAALA